MTGQINWDKFAEGGNYVKIEAGIPQRVKIKQIDEIETEVTNDGVLKKVPALMCIVDTADENGKIIEKEMKVISKRLAQALKPIVQQKGLPVEVEITKRGENFNTQYKVVLV